MMIMMGKHDRMMGKLGGGFGVWIIESDFHRM